MTAQLSSLIQQTVLFGPEIPPPAAGCYMTDNKPDRSNNMAECFLTFRALSGVQHNLAFMPAAKSRLLVYREPLAPEDSGDH